MSGVAGPQRAKSFRAESRAAQYGHGFAAAADRPTAGIFVAALARACARARLGAGIK
jgi:hypothetical protein